VIPSRGWATKFSAGTSVEDVGGRIQGKVTVVVIKK
jgi:hypothetical protein